MQGTELMKPGWVVGWVLALTPGGWGRAKVISQGWGQQAGVWPLLLDWARAAGQTGLCWAPVLGCDVCPASSSALPQLRWEEVGPACSHGGTALCLPGLWVAPAGWAPSPWWCWHLHGTQAHGPAPDGWSDQAGASLVP